MTNVMIYDYMLVHVLSIPNKESHNSIFFNQEFPAFFGIEQPGRVTHGVTRNCWLSDRAREGKP